MKGIVFSEFLEMVEDKFSIELADQIVQESDLASEGAYTAVGTYDHAEIVQLVVRLSEHSGVPVVDLVRTFGQHLLERFVVLYPGFFDAVTTTFEFLSSIENHVHVEVKKLYPDAELPTFTAQFPDADTLYLEYQSKRPFAALAEGLILGSIDYFQDSITLTHEDLSASQGNHSRFVLKRQAT